ncbi:hypothetical protein GCM10007913_11440 [Devosia yakushimensis]|uniref:Holin n=1 Tax=Devosia yakushimensis TaxID=470028 RepID=A0ABQ5UAR2_9HYPH|nr:hypothetical protein [Devosia yakushimensis]GLQ09212.1 hypothetical protein GCM10007913_11440 [Devosia yakushimensis]
MNWTKRRYSPIEAFGFVLATMMIMGRPFSFLPWPWVEGIAEVLAFVGTVLTAGIISDALRQSKLNGGEPE